MISGLSSSGIATAIRTAGQARATMDTMTRQIATGQRVASVRDDGATWARANVARGDAAASEALSSSLGQMRVGLAAAVAVGDARKDLLAELRGTALAATDPSLSAATRAELQAQFTALRQAYLGEMTYAVVAASTVELRNSTGGAWAPFTATAGAADLTWTQATDGTTTTQTQSVMAGPSADISTSAAATTTLANIQSVESQMLQRVAALSGIDGRVGADQARLSAASDRLSALAARLTEADLGKAAAARAQAETRQQLALSTVRQAISTYGSFASGLLGNAQRTQRGVLA